MTRYKVLSSTFYLDSDERGVLSGKALIASLLSLTLHFSFTNQGKTLTAIPFSSSIILVLKGRKEPAIFKALLAISGRALATSYKTLDREIQVA